MSSSTCSFWGFIFVFVSVISPKCVDGWVWVADDLSLGLGSRSGDKGDEGSGGGGGKLKCWNELNEGSGRGGNCGGRMKLLNDGGDGGRRGNPPLLLLLSFLLNSIFSFRNTSSLFRILKSTPGVGFFFNNFAYYIFFSNIEFSKERWNNWILPVKCRNVFKHQLERVLVPENIFWYRI